ncbi:MAG TPA: hypothetical protein VKY31_00295 [Terriglobia bacterium]|nr:hypothetical protein [Terriglobia bacterium]
MFFKRTLPLIAMLLIPVFVSAETPAEEDHGWSFAQRFQGISNSAGLILKTSSTATYSFNANIKAYAGLPVYFARAASTSGSSTSFMSGLGNAYSGFLVTAGGPSLRYTSDLTGTVPTGDQSRGFSTGHPTVDWSNTFSRTINKFIPYGTIGIANTVSDTSFFVPPFTSKGAVAHYEMGGIVNVTSHVMAGGSFYGVRATGEQTIITKSAGQPVTQPASSSTSSTPQARIATPSAPTVPSAPTAPSLPTTTGVRPPATTGGVTNPLGNGIGNGNGGGNGIGNGNSPVSVIEAAPQKTTVPAAVLNDHGFSTWLSLKASPTMDFQIGYSRSQAYQFNSVFFGVGFHIGHYAIVK